jgi:hypothetical protein
MAILLANPDAVITLTVNRFLSATQGQVMSTAGSNPDVTTALSIDTTGRVSWRSNNEFELSGGDPQGNHPITLHFVVLSKEIYAAVDLVVRKLTPISTGGTEWDQLTVGNGANDNVIAVRDHGRVPSPTQPITYEFYMFIKRRRMDNDEDFPFGDIGVIDPLWINR